jgi:hypothetical protein
VSKCKVQVGGSREPLERNANAAQRSGALARLVEGLRQACVRFSGAGAFRLTVWCGDGCLCVCVSVSVSVSVQGRAGGRTDGREGKRDAICPLRRSRIRIRDGKRDGGWRLEGLIVGGGGSGGVTDDG